MTYKITGTRHPEQTPRKKKMTERKNLGDLLGECPRNRFPIRTTYFMTIEMGNELADFILESGMSKPDAQRALMDFALKHRDQIRK
jgi:hypothetical protein